MPQQQGMGQPGYGQPAAQGLAIPGMGGMRIGADAAKYAGKFPDAAIFGFAIAAAVVGTIFDILFNFIHLGGWLWWLVTALSFAAAGFAAGLMTKAPKMKCFIGVGVGAVVYAILTVVVYVVLLGALAGAVGAGVGIIAGIMAAGINFVIAIGAGFGGVHQGTRQRAAAGLPI